MEKALKIKELESHQFNTEGWTVIVGKPQNADLQLDTYASFLVFNLELEAPFSGKITHFWTIVHSNISRDLTALVLKKNEKDIQITEVSTITSYLNHLKNPIADSKWTRFKLDKEMQIEKGQFFGVISPNSVGLYYWIGKYIREDSQHSWLNFTHKTVNVGDTVSISGDKASVCLLYELEVTGEFWKPEKEIHEKFPPKFQKIVKTMLLCKKYTHFPKPIIWMIIKFI